MRIKKLSITGLFFDPISNSLNQHHKNCMADSKENYQWDLGGEWVKPWGFHQVPPICLLAGIQVYFRAEKCLNNYGCYVLLLPMPPHLTRACNLYSVSGNINLGDINLFLFTRALPLMNVVTLDLRLFAMQVLLFKICCAY